MTVFLFLPAALALLAVVGFIRNRPHRNEDRRHLVSFVGFSAAVVASCLMVATLAVMWWLGPARRRYLEGFPADVLAVSSIMVHLSTLVAFCAGFFGAAGTWRIF